MAHVLSGRKESSPDFVSSSSALPLCMIDFVFLQARDNHLRHLLIPTRGSTKSRNSVNACHTSCLFRYSNDTSRLTWLVGGASRSRNILSSKVRYRPFTRKTKKDTSAAAEWIFEIAEESLVSFRTVGLGSSYPLSLLTNQSSHRFHAYCPPTVKIPYKVFCDFDGETKIGPFFLASVNFKF